MSTRATLPDRPRGVGRTLRRGGLGLLAGALAGWIAGLLRTPSEPRR